MRDKETNLWLSEPPEWPLICGELSSSSHNLEEYLRCEELDDECYGTVYSVGEFIHWCRGLETEEPPTMTEGETKMPSVDESRSEDGRGR
jgi:hypothetical protein